LLYQLDPIFTGKSVLSQVKPNKAQFYPLTCAGRVIFFCEDKFQTIAELFDIQWKIF
jgi:hypothetical protein